VEPMVLSRHARVVTRGRHFFSKLDCSRVNPKKMKTPVQKGRVEESLTEYEKLRASNMKRNAIMLQKLGIPAIEGKNKKKKIIEAEKGNKTHTTLVEKEK
jgi:hypothetical protein